MIKISPYEKNAKEHPREQVEKIAASIKAFGMNQPIVVDKDGVIIVGHGRYEALQLLGWELKPEWVIKKEDLTPEEVAAYRLADNKLNESAWDMKLVVEELRGMSLPMLDLTGFSRDLVLEDDEKDDVIPEVEGEPRSKRGDVYMLGSHRVMCGDSTNADDVAVLMQGTKADLIFTDPPYNVAYQGRGETTSRTIENDDMSDEAFAIFLNEVFKRYRENIKLGAGSYVFHSTSTQDQFAKAMEDNGFSIKNQLIWNKPTASMGWGDYRWKHEPFYYAGLKDVPTQFYGDRTNATVIDLHKSEQDLMRWAKREKKLESEGKTTIWTMKRDSVQGYKHPTQKPVELITYALANSSKMGDVVLDLFLGSGSTLIASEKSGRICFGMELDPTFIDVIVTRYVQYTGINEVTKNGETISWLT